MYVNKAVPGTKTTEVGSRNASTVHKDVGDVGTSCNGIIIVTSLT